MNRFTLSSSQQKELLIRAQPLLIALPMLKDCETDEAATQLAREWLVLPDGCAIPSAQPQEIEVSTPLSNGSRSNLTDVLGSILRNDGDRAGHWLITRQVVLMAIVRGPQERHPLKPPQWPGGTLLKEAPHEQSGCVAAQKARRSPSRPRT